MKAEAEDMYMRALRGYEKTQPFYAFSSGAIATTRTAGGPLHIRLALDHMDKSRMRWIHKVKWI